MIQAIPVLGVCVAALAGGPPANNDCIASTPVFNGDTPFDNFGATTDGIEHASCAPGPVQIESDVWFSYLPVFTGDITVSLCGSGFDTQLAVYSTAICPAGDAILLACNDDACGLQSQVIVPVNPTAITLIRVGGVGGEQGVGTLSIAKTFPPGEECTSCRPPQVNVAIDSTTAQNRGTLDDTSCGLLDTVDEWWCWTAPESGSIDVRLHGSSASMTAAVFTGGCDTLAEIACVVDDDILGLPVQAGVTYRIRFAAEIFTTATYTWELITDAAPPCPGDTNADGEVDVDDLNNVILDWGTDGSANGGDLTGPQPGSPPDGIVNVNDLNAVIVGWGACP